MQKENWCMGAVGVLALLVLIYIFGKYGIPVLAPFLLSGAIALFVHPWGKRLSKLTALRPGICNLLVLLVLLGVFGGALYLGGYYLWREAVSFYTWLSENANSLIVALGGLFSTKGEGIFIPDFLQKLLELPFIADFFGGLDSLAQTLVKALLGRLGEAVTSAALHFATSLPSLALSVLVFCLSCFYLSLDGERLFLWVIGLWGEEKRERARAACAAVAEALRGYLRAYGLIFCLTFTELLIGFWIIGVRYAFLIAALTALVDLLPVLGSGAVLLPWSAVSFLSGNVKTGAGLLILYGVVTLVRQIAEPKIVGKSLGLHPLATLASMYVAFRLFGAAGLVIGPCAAIVLRTVARSYDCPAGKL